MEQGLSLIPLPDFGILFALPSLIISTINSRSLSRLVFVKFTQARVICEDGISVQLR